ncbi:uncharacterized protein LOC118263478 isoform X3 [Spodoptera frugiperda]|uniref:Uncharacterized protein LOC118263478 isoform X3 n=1 Tax=Spodoptera frugiperda TaxID=7108 RepID=A0A9R0CWA7_SPOFR|nr:uncharacterized protein LOC118263478 isoform X3 [Spodoptera frugiperda]
MSALTSLLKFFTKQSVKKQRIALSCISGNPARNYADKQEVNSKHAVVQGNENDDRMRVRRARVADVPRVLRFVREHAKTAWPGLISSPPSASQLVLSDYVARALAQGHSMLAEQQEPRRGWSQIRGLALGMSVCPWDAMLLERWARCVRCTRSRRLMHFTAHCLRAPALHDKYRVHNVLQIILIVPHDSPKNTEIVHLLVKNAIQRGRDVGFPVLRFDVADDAIASALEDMKLKKEWQLMYDVLPDVVHEQPITETTTSKTATRNSFIEPGNFIAVYTALTKTHEKNSKDSKCKNKV